MNEEDEDEKSLRRFWTVDEALDHRIIEHRALVSDDFKDKLVNRHLKTIAQREKARADFLSFVASCFKD